MALSRAQVGILRDVRSNKIDLNTCSEWVREQLVDIILRDGQALIDTAGPSVFLTEAGNAFIDAVETLAPVESKQPTDLVKALMKSVVFEELKGIKSDLLDEIDGGDECQGRDTRITSLIQKVEAAIAKVEAL